MMVTSSLPAKRTAGLLAATALFGGLVASHPAIAQDAATLQGIQAQISALQAQLRQLQRQAAERDAELKRARADAAQARADSQKAVQQSAAPPPAAFPPPQVASGPALKIPPGTVATPVVLIQSNKPDADGNLPASGRFQVGGVTITLGGYLDLTGVYRSANVTSGTGTPFKSIPFGNSPNDYVNEFRMTAQQTRISLGVAGNVTDTAVASGYIETDFNGAGTTSNSGQSNSYTPRLRQAYAAYDDSGIGVHVLAGQTWSLATLNTKGMLAPNTQIPLTLDSNYLPGFTYTRNAQIRISKDFGGKYWIGASLESPQAGYSISPTTNSGSTLPPVNGARVGTTVTYNNAGGSNLNSSTTYSIDPAPDVIVKAAADPGFGHYEVYGLGRWIRTRTSIAGGPGTNQTEFGGGIGGGAVLPVSKYLDLYGSVLGGTGIGRYGAGSLPDASFKGNGAPSLIPEIMGYVGAVGHVTPRVDVFAYGGTEQEGRATYTSGVGRTQTTAGYGTSSVNVSGCDIENSTCNAQVRSLANGTVGVWWKAFKGSYGTIQLGTQYGYTKVLAYHGTVRPGVGGTPSTDENTVYFTVRYTPFQ